MKKTVFSAVMLVALTVFFTFTASAISLRFDSNPNGSIGPYNFEIKNDLAAPGPTTLGALPDGIVKMVCNDIDGSVPDVPGVGGDEDNGIFWEVQKHALRDSNLEIGTGSIPPALTKAKFYENTVAPFIYAKQLEYRAGAYLADIVLTTTGTTRSNAQNALWRLFNPTHASANSLSYQATLDNLINVAKGKVIDGSWTDWKYYAVYTRVPLNGPPRGTQELYAKMVKVPEAASLASLGLYFGGFGLLGYAFRRRMK